MTLRLFWLAACSYVAASCTRATTENAAANKLPQLESNDQLATRYLAGGLRLPLFSGLPPKWQTKQTSQTSV